MNEETKTLLEKLEIIKTGKSNIYNALIAIGASQFLNEDTQFIDYGDVIAKTHTKVVETCTVLEYLLFGAANMDSIKDNKLTYAQLGTYLEEMTRLRSKLIDNINVKGVSCTDNDSLETLVDKVLKINGGGSGGESVHDYLKVSNIINVDTDYYEPSSYNVYISSTDETKTLQGGNYILDWYDYVGNHFIRNFYVDEPMSNNLLTILTYPTSLFDRLNTLDWDLANIYTEDEYAEITGGNYELTPVNCDLLSLQDINFDESEETISFTYLNTSNKMNVLIQDYLELTFDFNGNSYNAQTEHDYHDSVKPREYITLTCHPIDFNYIYTHQEDFIYTVRNLSNLHFSSYSTEYYQISYNKVLYIEINKDGELYNLYEQGALYNLDSYSEPSGSHLKYREPVRFDSCFTDNIDNISDNIFCYSIYVLNDTYGNHISFYINNETFDKHITGDILTYDYYDLIEN